MKKILYLIICLAVAGHTFAQKFQWAVHPSGASADWGKSLATDAKGNVYSVGFFQLTVDFNPDTPQYLLTSAGDFDFFVMKTDSAGKFIWARRIGGVGLDEANSIALDDSANIYVTGSFSLTADFDPGPAITNLSSAGNRDAFICKLDSSGAYKWAVKAGASQTDYANDIAVGPAGNIVITGMFIGTVDFNPGPAPFLLSSTGGTDIFMLKLNRNGGFVWAKKIGSTINDEGITVDVDEGSGIYLGGKFQSTADFNPDTTVVFNLVSAGGNDGFIARYDSAGHFIWARQLRGPGSEIVYSLSYDGSGRIVSCGIFSDSADFDPGPAALWVKSNGHGDAFCLVLDAPGNYLWAHTFGGPQSDYASCAMNSPSGKVFIAGQFRDSADVDPGPGVTKVYSNGGLDVFLLCFSDTGSPQWNIAFGGTGDEYAQSLATDGNGSVHLTGLFTNSVDFDPGAGSAILSGFGDPYLLKLTDCSSVPVIQPAGQVTVCSGSSVKFTTVPAGSSYQWKKNGTALSGATGPSLKATTAGQYTADVENACGNFTTGAVNLSVNSLPNTSISVSGATTFCSGGSVVLSTGSSGNKTYQWKKNGSLISGATTSSYTATGSGTYKVKVTNTVTGCSNTTTTGTAVTVNDNPPGTVTASGPLSFCAGDSVELTAAAGNNLSYQWRRNGTDLPGETTQSFTAKTNGTYKVRVTRTTTGCSTLSSGQTVTVSCRGVTTTQAPDGYPSLYPNPAHDRVTLLCPVLEPGLVQVFNSEGRLFFEGRHDGQETFIISLNNFPAGIYAVSIVTDKGSFVLRLAVM